MNKKLVHIIAGPTASGKSSYAIETAERLGGTIINADSMQIYDGLHKLTAQPSEDDLSKVPHKLYSLLHPNEKCSAQKWLELAMAEIDKVDTPIVTGGTGLYFRTLIEGMSFIPDVPIEVREGAVGLQKELGNPAFHESLSKIDPEVAEKLHCNDTQRLIRAYEVITHTGKSILYWQSKPSENRPDYEFDITIFNLSRDVLYDRCNKRFDLMIEQNILEEIEYMDQQMKSENVPKDCQIANALGFKPLLEFIDNNISLEDAIEQAKQDTRRYAKRQDTWFRNQIKKKSGIVSLSYIN